MFWKLIDRAVQLTFLLLAVVLLTTLLKNDKYNSDLQQYTLRLEQLSQKFDRVMDHNVLYLEEKSNRVQSQSDSYQVSTTRRLDVLEERVQRLVKDQKEKVSNINVNSNTINNK